MPDRSSSARVLYPTLLLACVFSTWASYLIHIGPMEQPALDVLRQLLSFEGRAPDQYRILPLLIIKGLNGAGGFIENEWLRLRSAVLIFDTVFLFLSACLIHRKFSTRNTQLLIWMLCLSFPFLMFDGYKPFTSFLLCLCLLSTMSLREMYVGNRKAVLPLFLCVALLSFSRADVALVYALLSFGSGRASLAMKLLISAIPVCVQLLLSRVLFPEAEYFTKLVMLEDNITLLPLLHTPTTYLIAAVLVFYFPECKEFASFLFTQRRTVLVVLLGYTLLLFIIARPNEYRLFLPLLPILLWTWSEFSNRTTSESTSDG